QKPDSKEEPQNPDAYCRSSAANYFLRYDQITRNTRTRASFGIFPFSVQFPSLYRSSTIACFDCGTPSHHNLYQGETQNCKTKGPGEQAGGSRPIAGLPQNPDEE